MLSRRLFPGIIILQCYCSHLCKHVDCRARMIVQNQVVIQCRSYLSLLANYSWNIKERAGEHSQHLWERFALYEPVRHPFESGALALIKSSSSQANHKFCTISSQSYKQGKALSQHGSDSWTDLHNVFWEFFSQVCVYLDWSALLINQHDQIWSIINSYVKKCLWFCWILWWNQGFFLYFPLRLFLFLYFFSASELFVSVYLCV